MYIISGKNASGLVSLRRETPVGAIKKAVELMGSGYIEVRIIAPDGAIYAEFDQCGLLTRT
jgi:hypothetical protein